MSLLLGPLFGILEKLHPQSPSLFVFCVKDLMVKKASFYLTVLMAEQVGLRTDQAFCSWVQGSLISHHGYGYLLYTFY